MAFRALTLVSLLVALLASREARADEREACERAYEGGQRLRKQGQLVESRAVLLVCAQPVCAAFIRTDCTRWLLDLDTETPTVVVVALDDDGRDLPSPSVSIDGALVANSADGLPHPLNPGAHLFRLDAGTRHFDKQVVVRSGEARRRIELRLPPAAPPQPTSAVQLKRPIPKSVFVLEGIAVASVAAGSVLWVTGSDAANSYNRECAAVTGCTSAARVSVLRQLIAGDALWGVGLASAVAGAVVYLARPTRTVRAGMLDIRALPGGVLAAYGASF